MLQSGPILGFGALRAGVLAQRRRKDVPEGARLCPGVIGFDDGLPVFSEVEEVSSAEGGVE